MHALLVFGTVAPMEEYAEAPPSYKAVLPPLRLFASAIMITAYCTRLVVAPVWNAEPRHYGACLASS